MASPFHINQPPPRNFSNEINQILGQSSQYFTNAQAYDPQYQNLALDLYGQAIPSINNVLNQANSASRASTMGDLSAYGAQGVNAIRGMNPGQTEIYHTLVGRAKSQLAAGNRLTPNQTYGAVNPARSSWAARGFSGDSLAGQLDEAVALSRTGDNVEQQRQQFAGGVAEMGNQFYTQPTMGSILGTGSQAAGSLGAVMGTGQDETQGLMAYGSDLFNTNFNQQAAAGLAAAANATSRINGAASY